MGLLRPAPIDFLDAIWHDYEPSPIERVLDPLGKAISECDQRIEQAEKYEDPQYLDSVIDEEVYIVEDLLGIAFVVCQTDITYTVSRIKALHGFCKTSKNIILTTTKDCKEDLMALDPQMFLGTTLTQVQVIDAFANYFKHKDEWHQSWNEIEKSKCISKKTVQNIIAAGAEEYSNGNFRGASQKLGNTAYDNMEVFTTILQTWKRHIRTLYEAELRKQGLL